MSTPSPYLIAKVARNTVATASVSATTITARVLRSSYSTSTNVVASTFGDSSHSTMSAATPLSGSGSRPFPTYKYPFPSIPRPRRNLFYYYNPMPSIKRGLSSIPDSKPGKFVRRSSAIASRFRRNSSGAQDTLNVSNTNGMPSYKTFSKFNTYGRRFASSAAGGAKKGGPGSIGLAAAQSWKWWAVPAVTSIIIWTAYRRKKQQQQQRDDETQPLLGQQEHDHKPAKPWQVAAYSTLPLKAMSRLWGKVNDITLPVWMREPGFKLYSYMFGVNLDEVAEDDLTTYRNLGEFFFRELKPGVRPIDPDAVLVSPADGQVLHLGVIDGGKVEQVKGITYSLDALLGGGNYVSAAPSHEVDFDLHEEHAIMERHKDFAVVNGISYTLDDLIGGGGSQTNVEKRTDQKVEDEGDATVASVNSSTSSFVNVSKDVLAPDFTPESEKELFFAVIYLAPGDYHRFHSPANWVAEIRRHFVGELYSVAPYFQSRLQNLFCLNERVALLGRWKHGFFSMTPVGATNVGSIIINFDKNLRTNTVYEHPNITPNSSSSSISSLPDITSSGEQTAQRKKVKKATCYEATYGKASRLLGGYPISKGEQMGGFNLGSTVVLVFEAPKTFHFNVKAGQKVKVGQALGTLPS
ncbi:phosphatidylserine decarboxylase 1 [Sugiyamaella lignohabitans]|uniref:Phosphatidylserine decarboxylase proenzyme 1, mitochondrial n=1 Tax=Sugiyamaella lignohabitans TaxID=796027 RepID=A0A161HKF3_9ASCO|nr:phosphatidylserine decarboxylase 1 [Sugiyamaella lignohabitans]ANB12148.1 phosphatidylserine decarboxylase 1 [Sugiyamaella lignohabitans]